MRVITGSARGMALKAPKGMDTRPTMDQVKEGIFSAIQFEVEGRRVLDLFAGSGQMGIAVSYTHLDVYKRQRMVRASILKEETIP